jgi:hypothetical protein
VENVEHRLFVFLQGPGGTPTSSGSIRTLVAGSLDVSSSCPRRHFFEVLSHWATEEHERERLQYFASVVRIPVSHRAERTRRSRERRLFPKLT